MAPYNEADRRLDSCIRAGDMDGVMGALRGGAGQYPGPDGRYPIHAAASQGHEVIVTALLRAGADPHTKSKMHRDDGGKAIHLASEGGHHEIIRALAAAGAHLDTADDKGRTPVHWAALRGQLDALVTLYNLGADLTSLDSGQANALHFAASSGSLEVIRWLVEVGGVSVTQLDLNSRSPYAIARRKGHKHLLGYLKQTQQNQQSFSVRQQPSESAGTSAWVFRQQESPSEDSQAESASIISQPTQHVLALRSRSQDLPTWSQGQQNQHTYPPRPRSQHDLSAWSQQNVPPRTQDSTSWDHRRQSSQKETSAWVRSQQDEEPRSALSLLTQQCQDYRRKIAEMEEREAQVMQRAAADQQTLAELRKEVSRLTGILQSEVHTESGRQIASLRQEIQHLTLILNDTGRRAIVTQDAQQKRIEGLKNQEEINKRTLTELTRRLTLAEESNSAMMAEARERERSETLLKGEVDRLKLSLSSAPNSEAYTQLQARAQRLSEQDTIHRQAILTLRRELEAARAPPPPPPVPTPLVTIAKNTEQRKLREALMEAEKRKEEAETLSVRLREFQARAGEAEKLANAYKRQLGECERELREEKETNGKMVVSLREEMAEMKSRMEAVKKKAITRSTSVSS